MGIVIFVYPNTGGFWAVVPCIDPFRKRKNAALIKAAFGIGR